MRERYRKRREREREEGRKDKDLKIELIEGVRDKGEYSVREMEG